ncbi:MAG: recombinase family protein [Thermoplasmatota archaeon]|jgi:DNA invertase Pin-like site-specific DNA recombinase
MDEKNVRAALYTRVSTEDQAKEGFSLDAQIDKLKAYCKARDWNVAGEYIEDGYSGRNIRRPAYTRLVNEIDQWDVLLVMKMDRIHRNSKNFMMMMEELKKHGKEFVSMTESLDTSTAMGRFVMDIIQRIAQLESEQIGERVYSGMEQKARVNGGHLGFNIPYGYDYVNGTLIINEDESRTVDHIFNQYEQGLSMARISEILNEQRIPTKQKRTWGRQTVSNILKNPLYCGTFHWENIQHKEVYPSIINEGRFNDIQKIINKKKIKS